jgi:hypothetical protein
VESQEKGKLEDYLENKYTRKRLDFRMSFLFRDTSWNQGL